MIVQFLEDFWGWCPATSSPLKIRILTKGTLTVIFLSFWVRYLLTSVPNVAGIFCDGHHVLVCFVLHFIQVFHVPLDVVAVGHSPEKEIVFFSEILLKYLLNGRLKLAFT